LDGPFLPLLALLAGLLSCSSPCTLPLIPGYLGYISGVSSTRGRASGAALLFVLGFSTVFVALGTAASGLGAALLAHRLALDELAGVAIILLGLFMLGCIRLPFLLRERRPLLALITKTGPGGALLLGIAFALGWTPCLGPVLGAILLLASSQQTLAAGAGLLLLYSLGLGIPFITAALCLDRFRSVASRLQRHGTALNAAGGLLLVGMGTLIFAGQLNQLLAPALELYARLKWPPI
jgi:cytochrome c-type biogenesis protein